MYLFIENVLILLGISIKMPIYTINSSVNNKIIGLCGSNKINCIIY